MAYFLYHTNAGSFIDIKTSNTNTDFPFISIDEDQKNSVLKAKADKTKLIKVIDGKIKVIINESLKRKDIVKFRDQELKKIDPYFTERYQKYLGLTEEDINLLNAYYIELLELPQAFDSADDKQAFTYEIVKEKTMGIMSTNLYQMVKPSFIKE